MTWLLDEPIRASIEAARASGQIVSAEQIAQVEQEEAAKAPTTRGAQAVIPIDGVLTNKRDFLSAVFGGGNTLYPDIIRAVEAANADSKVDEIVLAVGATPGGTIAGLFPAMEAIRNSSKPVKAIVEDMALSAGYGLVSQADEIIAMTPVTQFGNVGIVKTVPLDKGSVDITSTNAPKKRPDASTEEGVAAIRENLDDVHEQFVNVIAQGRGTTPDKVNKNYGQGASMIAPKALSAGMITSIFSRETTNTASDGGEEVKAMNLEEFKATHPALYAEAVELGKAQALDLVQAHAHRGRECGNLEIALKAIEEGTEMTELMKAQYDTAQNNKNAVEARAAENPESVGTVTEPVAAQKKDDIATLMEEAMALEDSNDNYVHVNLDALEV